MTRDQHLQKAECLRRDTGVQVGTSNEIRHFQSINDAKRFVGRRTCVALRRGESFRGNSNEKV